MRELSALELDMVVGGDAAPAAVCVSGNSNGTVMNTCVIGDNMVTTACTNTVVEVNGKASAKIGATGELSVAITNPACTTTVVNPKTGTVTTTTNSPQRSTPSGSSSGKKTGSLVIEDYFALGGDLQSIV